MKKGKKVKTCLVVLGMLLLSACGKGNKVKEKNIYSNGFTSPQQDFIRAAENQFSCSGSRVTRSYHINSPIRVSGRVNVRSFSLGEGFLSGRSEGRVFIGTLVSEGVDNSLVFVTSVVDDSGTVKGYNIVFSLCPATENQRDRITDDREITFTAKGGLVLDEGNCQHGLVDDFLVEITINPYGTGNPGDTYNNRPFSFRPSFSFHGESCVYGN